LADSRTHALCYVQHYLPDKLVQFVTKQVKVSAAEIDLYDWGGRTIKGHRKELRETLGWRPCSVPDAEKLPCR
jgi:hypothetical protein